MSNCATQGKHQSKGWRVTWEIWFNWSTKWGKFYVKFALFPSRHRFTGQYCTDPCLTLWTCVQRQILCQKCNKDTWSGVIRQRSMDTGEHSYSPAGTPCGGRRRSGCPGRPTGHGWMAGSAEKLWAPPCRDHEPSLTGCQTPSWCLRAAGWTGCPMGCVASLERPPTLVYLKEERNTRQYFVLALVQAHCVSLF